MAEVKFILKEPNSKTHTLIYLFFRFNTQRLKYSTGQKINPKFWNPEKQRAKETRSFPEYAGLNAMLDDLATKAKNVYRALINLGTSPTPQKLKLELNKSLFKEQVAQKKTFLGFIKELIDQSARKHGTLKHWNQTLRLLTKFQKTTKKEVDFDTINLDFYNFFVQFLTKEGYAKNTIGGHVKNIKIFMNEALDRRLTQNLEYRNRKFKVTEEQVDKIYLSQQEITKIYELDLSGKEKLQKVRDLFVIACFTGLRFTDLMEVKAENIINSGNQIRIRTEKTGEVVVIPIHRFVREILAKYNGGLPPVISNQKMNEYLKEIGELAEIDETVKFAITRGGKTVHELEKKFDLITVHTARRSFATNAYLMDIPAISIMKITGHRTEKSFLKYIRISQEDNANKLLNHPFFGN